MKNNEKKNIFKKPKIPFKTPTKIPSFLDLNNNQVDQIGTINIFQKTIQRSDSISTNDSEDSINSINKNECNFEVNESNNFSILYLVTHS